MSVSKNARATSATSATSAPAKKAAKANYTEDQLATMRSMYKGVDNTAELAAIGKRIGKTVPSVRAKLAADGLYVTPKKATATSGGKVTKTDKAEKIGKAYSRLQKFERYARLATGIIFILAGIYFCVEYIILI